MAIPTEEDQGKFTSGPIGSVLSVVVWCVRMLIVVSTVGGVRPEVP